MVITFLVVWSRTLFTLACFQGSEVKDENCHGDYEAIDDFYKGDLPEWIPDDALAQSSYKQPEFYEVRA